MGLPMITGHGIVATPTMTTRLEDGRTRLKVMVDFEDSTSTADPLACRCFAYDALADQLAELRKGDGVHVTGTLRATTAGIDVHLIAGERTTKSKTPGVSAIQPPPGWMSEPRWVEAIGEWQREHGPIVLVDYPHSDALFDAIEAVTEGSLRALLDSDRAAGTFVAVFRYPNVIAALSDAGVCDQTTVYATPNVAHLR
jgi:hypothetical protein